MMLKEIFYRFFSKERKASFTAQRQKPRQQGKNALHDGRTACRGSVFERNAVAGKRGQLSLPRNCRGDIW